MELLSKTKGKKQEKKDETEKNSEEEAVKEGGITRN
jgi:hypothetical protein